MGNTCSSSPKEDTKSEDNGQGVVRYLRDVPPSHYIFKIESFTSFSECQSGVFESGGYKWKLALNPNGYGAASMIVSYFNQNRKKWTSLRNDKHISLNLVITETEALPSGWDVNVFFRFFLFDQIRDKYLTVEAIGWKYRRFHAMKTEWGLSHFIPHAMLRQPGNGYIVNDTCVFGAEVFVYKSSGQGECLCMIKGAETYTHIWKIERFSQLTDVQHLSQLFSAGGQKWRLCLFPNGEGESKNKKLSVFLVFVDSDSSPPAGKVYVEFDFRIKDQLHGKYVHANGGSHYFCTSESNGGVNLIKLNDLNNEANGFLVNDTCIIEADITARAVVNKLP